MRLGHHLRLGLGVITLSVFWSALGGMLFSASAAPIVFAIALIVAPIFVPAFFWYGLQYRRKLARLSLDTQPHILKHLYRKILAQPGPQIELWIYFSPHSWSFDFAWPWNPKRILILSEGLLTLKGQSLVINPPDSSDRAPYRAIQCIDRSWSRSLSSTRASRQLEFLQLCYWLALISPLAVLVQMLILTLRALGIEAPQALPYFLVPGLWRLRDLWFGTGFQFAATKDFFDLRDAINPNSPIRPDQLSASRNYDTIMPYLWSSVLWSTWVDHYLSQPHPIWNILGRQRIIKDLQRNYKDSLPFDVAFEVVGTHTSFRQS